MSEQDERVPDVPFVITVTWAPGDSLLLDYPDLEPWEARAALEQAVEQTRIDEAQDREEQE